MTTVSYPRRLSRLSRGSTFAQFCLASGCLGAFLVGSPINAYAQSSLSFTAVDLGTLGGNITDGYAINSLGQVVGTTDLSSGTQRSFVYTPGQGMVDFGSLTNLGKFGLGYTGISDINSSGTIIGNSDSYGAYVYTPGQGVTPLVSLTSLGPSGANAINESGQIVGSSPAATGPAEAIYNHAFVYTPGQGIKDLGTLGGTTSSASDINNVGQVAGTSLTAQQVNHAFLYTPGQGMMDLGTLGGTTSLARGINDAGVVVGSSTDSSGVTHGFIYTPGQGMTALGTLGGSGSNAVAINSLGEVVGNITNANNTNIIPFVYNAGQMVSLDPVTSGLGSFVLTNVSAINDSGYILASGLNNRFQVFPSDGIKRHTFLLIPNSSTAPEPGTLALIFTGIGLLAFRLRRRDGRGFCRGRWGGLIS